MHSEEKKKQLAIAKQKYLAASKEKLKEFDKNFFFVNVGIFAFTVTFIKDIISIHNICWAWLLVISWISFTASTGIIIVIAFLSAAESAAMAEEITEEEKNETERTTTQKDNSVSYYWIRLLAVGAFCVGLVSLCLLLVINIYGNCEPEKKENPENDEKKGSVTNIDNRSSITQFPATKDSITLLIKPNNIIIENQSCSCAPGSGSSDCTPKCKRK